MRLVFVNRFYWPETPATGQLLTDLAEGLAQRGHTVEVITSRAAPTAPTTESKNSVRIHRVRGTRLSGNAGLIGKALDFATFYLLASAKCCRLARRDSTVVALTDPPLLGVGIGIAARMRGARFVQWVQDIYPEIASTLAKTRLPQLLAPMRNHAWRDADACATLGTDMARRLEAAGVPAARIAVIPNWALAGTSEAATRDVDALRREWELLGRFVVLYSGNLGRVHDLFPVLDLATALREQRDIAFVFVGDGAQRGALEALARQRALSNVIFQPPQPRQKLAAVLALADLHLVTLRADCADLVFPSKLYGAAAARRPILFFGPPDCEVARLVRSHAMGITASRDTLAPAARRVSELAANPAERAELGRNAAAFAQANDRSAAIERWSSVLASLQIASPGVSETEHARA